MSSSEHAKAHTGPESRRSPPDTTETQMLPHSANQAGSLRAGFLLALTGGSRRFRIGLWEPTENRVFAGEVSY